MAKDKKQDSSKEEATKTQETPLSQDKTQFSIEDEISLAKKVLGIKKKK